MNTTGTTGMQSFLSVTEGQIMKNNYVYMYTDFKVCGLGVCVPEANTPTALQLPQNNK